MSMIPDGQAMELAQVRKGSILFKQGERGDAAFLVNAGAIGIYREVEGQKIPLATIRKGELFGEMAVVDGSARMATAFAISDCTVTVISATTIAEKMRKVDPFIKSLVQMLMNSLRTVHSSYAPKTRSLLDSVTMLAKQRDSLAGFLKAKSSARFHAEFAARLNKLNDAVNELHDFVVANRDEDPREDAIPAEVSLR
jgi:CRP/FNR family cyclic AMP-dependent transcriptional regulator